MFINESSTFSKQKSGEEESQEFVSLIVVQKYGFREDGLY